MDRVPLETWFYEIPIVTRCFVTGAVLTSLLVQCDIVTPYQLFFSWHTAVTKGQYWRFITTFLFFGPLSIDFLFHLFFMSRYSRMLEHTYARRTVDFAWLMLLISAALVLVSAAGSDPYLGAPLSFALTYIWARRNATVEMSFLGLFQFSAAYLPLVLIGFSIVAHSRVPTADLLGLGVGHLYYFLEDVWPLNPASGGKRYLATPQIVRRLAGAVTTTTTTTAAVDEAAVPHVHVE